MRRSTVLGAVLTFAAPLVPSPAGAAADEAGSCTPPVPVREYTPEAMVYGLDLDLSGCEWWQGGEIQLVAVISRLDGMGEEVADVRVLCGLKLLPPPGEDVRFEPAKTSKCSVRNEMEHGPVEAARYEGELSYPWEGRTKTVGFVAVCSATPAGAQCVDGP